MKELMDRISAVCLSLDGWCTPEKACWLAEWIVYHRCVSVVEVGVFGGRSFIAMALAIMELQKRHGFWPGRVVGIDSYSNADCVSGVDGVADKEWWAKIDLAKIEANARAAISREGVGGVCDLRKMTGSEAAGSFDELTLDLVHVDGSHGVAQAKRDVNEWWPKLRHGGLFVMDDTNWDSVQPAREILRSLGRFTHNGEYWEAYQKT